MAYPRSGRSAHCPCHPSRAPAPTVRAPRPSPWRRPRPGRAEEAERRRGRAGETTWRLRRGRSVCDLWTYASDTQALSRSDRTISAYGTKQTSALTSWTSAFDPKRKLITCGTARLHVPDLLHHLFQIVPGRVLHRRKVDVGLKVLQPKLLTDRQHVTM